MKDPIKLMGVETLKWRKNAMTTKNGIKKIGLSRELGVTCGIPYWKILKFVLTEERKK